MKTKLFLVVATGLVGLGAVAQLRITSFNSSGSITWTNFARVGAYRVAWANSPAGPWNAFDTLTNLNLILARTNRVTVQLPLSNTPAFYRVAWIPPEPIGVWDYRGYDNQANLVITGQLSIVSKTLVSPNPPNPGYTVQGAWNLQYTGQGSSFCLYNQMGTGGFDGTLDVGYAYLSLSWPTNGCTDCLLDLFGTLWPDKYTGSWSQYPCGPFGFGDFTASRR